MAANANNDVETKKINKEAAKKDLSDLIQTLSDNHTTAVELAKEQNVILQDISEHIIDLYSDAGSEFGISEEGKAVIFTITEVLDDYRGYSLDIIRRILGTQDYIDAIRILKEME